MLTSPMSPAGRLGALMLTAILWMSVLDVSQGILRYKLVSYQYWDNTTNTVYPGWNTVVTTNKTVTNVRWNTSDGTLVTFNTVENNYLWMSLIPSVITNGGTVVVIDRASFCLPLIENTLDVTYINNDISVLQEKKEKVVIAGETTHDARYISECDFRIEYFAPRSQNLTGLLALRSEYYLPSFFYYSTMSKLFPVAYGPKYFNMNYCGIICTRIPTSPTFLTDIKSSECLEECCWHIPSMIGNGCVLPEFKDGSGIKRIQDIAVSITSDKLDPRYTTKELRVVYNGSYQVGYPDFNQMEVDGEIIIGSPLAGLDPKFRYRPASIRYQK